MQILTQIFIFIQILAKFIFYFNDDPDTKFYVDADPDLYF